MDTTPPPIPTSPIPPKPGVLLLVGTTLLVLVNMWLGFAEGMRDSGNISQALGSATAQLVMPVIVALLFSLSKRFKNPVSRTKVVFWTSVVLFVGAVAGAGRR